MNDKAKKYYDALDDLLDKPIAYNPAFRKITGRTSAAVWLSQVWYWSKRTSDPEGWFWKSARECEEETGLTDNEQMTARRVCLELGIIDEKLKGVPATMHYRLIKSKVYELLGLQFPTEQGTENPGNEETGSRRGKKQVSRVYRNLNTGNTSEITAIKEGAENPAPPKASQVPELVVFRAATGRYPARDTFETVIAEVQKVRSRLGRDVTADDLIPFWRAWRAKGYSPKNLSWLQDWAVSGSIPTFGSRPAAIAAPPAQAPVYSQADREAAAEILAGRRAG